MKSKITKFAAAAFIIVAVLLSYSIVGVKETYAFEQTLEAFRDVVTSHVWGRDWNDKEFEMWIQLDPNNGMPDYCRLYSPSDKYLAVSRPDQSYQYNENINQVQINSGRLFSFEVNPTRIFEELIKFSEMENSGYKVNINYERDPESKETIIVAIAETPMGEMWKISIDPETKLPIRFNCLNNEIVRPGAVFKDIDKIEYNVELPEGIFDFEIPKDAKIIDHDLNNKLIDDPQYGISTDGLTEQEAAEKIATAYWNALIAMDNETAKKVSPVFQHTADSKLLVELVEIGDIYIEPGVGIGKIIPCRLKYTDRSLKEWLVIIKQRNINGAPSCVIAGFCGYRSI